LRYSELGRDNVRKGLGQDLLKRLADIVGEKYVLTDDEKMEKYSHDETMGYQFFPDAAVMVETAEEVSKVLRLAGQYSIPVTPRGLGTGLSGGCLPIHRGIVLSMERMNQVLEIDEENLMVVTQPGVITGELHRTVEQQGLFYPPDPASLDSCSIGGTSPRGQGDRGRFDTERPRTMSAAWRRCCPRERSSPPEARWSRMLPVTTSPNS